MGTGSYLLLQDTDAHQWCEIYLEGAGWVVVDASPARAITPPDPEPDPVTQGHYGEKNREPEAAVVDRMKDEEHRASRPALPSPAMGLLAGSLLVLALYGAKIWRRLAPLWASERALDRVGYRAVLDRLAEVGLRRRFGETRGEFAERVRALVPELTSATAAHERRVQTGERRLERVAWVKLNERIAVRLAATFSRGRRLRGLADPLTWLNVS
jgi:hypothetical protein